tara:strand:- start:221 stop:541 length:321 start_codon:yes stop_codon:yes gene_type:complete
MPTFDLPEKVLAASEKVRLRDLLESPTFGYWLVSCLCNGVQASHMGLEEVSEDEDFFVFKVQQILSCIPIDTKRACFKQTALQVATNKNARSAAAQERSAHVRVIG